jgi:hypothetical protein
LVQAFIPGKYAYHRSITAYRYCMDNVFFYISAA